MRQKIRLQCGPLLLPFAWAAETPDAGSCPFCQVPPPPPRLDREGPWCSLLPSQTLGLLSPLKHTVSVLQLLPCCHPRQGKG